MTSKDALYLGLICFLGLLLGLSSFAAATQRQIADECTAAIEAHAEWLGSHSRALSTDGPSELEIRWGLDTTADVP